MTIAEKDKAFYRYTNGHRFAAMYPLLAREIVEKYAVRQGRCLDIGTGSAALAIEIARCTDLEITALDTESEVIAMARENCRLHGLARDRIRFLVASVYDMPLADASEDLVLSRGAIPFWGTYASAFREIYRVLSPGGHAMIGCGFSHYQTPEAVAAMRPKWSADTMKARMQWKNPAVVAAAMQQAGFTCYKLTGDAYGAWIEIEKPVA